VTRRFILGAQGAYYVATGLWPLFSMRTFERVTGPKADKWLVQMVGLLAAATGTSLLIATRDDRNEAAIALSIMSALSFASIDIVHAWRRHISPIYLADAIVEAAIVVTLINFAA
jgi:hypothetical protein